MDLHLEATVSDAGDDTLVSGVLRISEHFPDRPSDGVVLHLELVPASVRQLELLAVEPTVARLGDDGAVAGEHLLDVLEADVDMQRLPGLLALRRLPLGDEDLPVVLVGVVFLRTCPASADRKSLITTHPNVGLLPTVMRSGRTITAFSLFTRDD
jgi:hypothetical protein